MINLIPLAWDAAGFVEWTFFGDQLIALIGPLDRDGVLDSGNVITYRHGVDTITGAHSYFGENDVSHLQVEGEIYFNPYTKHITNIPTTSTPNQIQMKFDNGFTRTYRWGFPVPGSARVSANVILSYQPLTDHTVELYELIPISGTSKISRFQHHVVTLEACDSTSLRVRTATESIGLRSGYWTLPWAILDTQDHNQVAELYEKCKQDPKAVVAQFADPLQQRGIRWASNLSMALDAGYTCIDGAVQRMLYKAVKPSLYDYGDLAMEASSTVNATSINMIAFLRDFKDPTSMIPKLKNLKNLKGAADNYLTVQYGILPTISDISNIVAAFKRIIPYLDKNGFSTYTAGHSSSLKSDNIVTGLVQHLKLAVSKEDNVFESLCERLETIGMFPSMKNLWDLVPYSFALDWLVDVGALLERADAKTRLERLNIAYTTMSYKYTSSIELSIPSSGLLSGKLSLVDYHRWTTDHCPTPRLKLQSNLVDFDHWLESSALIIQRIK